MKTAIVGGGRGCRSLLEFLLERGGLTELHVDVRMVCDVRSHAPGARYASQRGIATTSRVEDIYRVEGLELVIELTGSDHTAAEIYHSLPTGVRLMDHALARLFWDLIQLEEKLRDERRQVQDILDGMPDIVLVVDPDMRIQTVNAGFTQFTGLSRTLARGHRCHDVLCNRWGSTSGREVECPFAEVLRSGKRMNRVQVLECVPGLEEHFEITITPLRNERGEITRVVESLHPISERVRLTREVEESARRFRQFIDSARDFISMKDLEGRYVTVNVATAELFGMEKDDLIGKTVEELYPGKIAAWIAQHDREVIEKGAPINYEEVLNQDGRELNLSTVRFPLRGYDGETVGVCTISRDVTEERRLGRQLVQADKLAAIGKLAAGVAHEINNPLTGILAFAEDLRDELCDREDLASDCDVIIRETLRCREIVRNLLDFAKQTRPRFGLASLNEVIENTVALVSRLAIFKDIRLEKALDAGLRPVHGDKHQLQQVILNLLVNAAEGMNGRGTVVIRTGWVADRRECFAEVIDEGPGIPEEMVGKIFEPFFSTKNTTQGLGLAVSWGIVDRHGGRIHVADRPEGGTVFRVSLPESEETSS